jgi:hypothetical protein
MLHKLSEMTKLELIALIQRDAKKRLTKMKKPTRNSIKPSRKSVTARARARKNPSEIHIGIDSHNFKKNPVKKAAPKMTGGNIRQGTILIYDIFTSTNGKTWAIDMAGIKSKIVAHRIAKAIHDETGAWVKVEPAKAKRVNPASSGEVRRATSLSKAFTGRHPEDHEYQSVPMPKLPKAMAAIGKIEAIEYIAERDGKEYIFRHQFKKHSRPHLAVSPDGKIATMIGGSWVFTEDGFEDS